MAYKEFVENLENQRESEFVPFGGFSRGPNIGKLLHATRVKYLVANTSDPTDQALLEGIFTKSLQCENQLVRSGDICIFKEESHFDRDGNYLVAVKYAEHVGETSKPEGTNDEVA